MGAARKPQVESQVPQEGLSMPHDDPWVSLRQAAVLRGRDKYTVLNEALDGMIRSRRVAGRRVFHRDDLESLRQRDEQEKSAKQPDPQADDRGIDPGLTE